LDLEENGLEQQIDLARMLVARLERLSADSYWAHQASGVRGSLLRVLDLSDYIILNPAAPSTVGLESRLKALNESGYKILIRAAIEKTPQRPVALRRLRHIG
jgi:hypothetical protein